MRVIEYVFPRHFPSFPSCILVYISVICSHVNNRLLFCYSVILLFMNGVVVDGTRYT